MKLWEVLKALEENRQKKFIHESGDQEVFFNGGIVIKEGSARKLMYLYDWQEVKQPVTWMEALGAWALEGKTIRCTLNDLDYIYKHESNHSGDVLLIESYGDPLEVDEIKHGTWYIEEETK